MLVAGEGYRLTDFAYNGFQSENRSGEKEKLGQLPSFLLLAARTLSAISISREPAEPEDKQYNQQNDKQAITVSVTTAIIWWRSRIPIVAATVWSIVISHSKTPPSLKIHFYYMNEWFCPIGNSSIGDTNISSFHDFFYSGQTRTSPLLHRYE